MFEQEHGAFAKRHERVEELRTVERRHRQQIEAGQHHVPENHQEKQSEQDARERSRQGLGQQAETVEKVPAAPDDADEALQNIHFDRERQRQHLGEERRQRRQQKIRSRSGERHPGRSPFLVAQIVGIVRHRFRPPERKAGTNDQKNRQNDRPERVDVLERIEIQAIGVFGRQIPEPQSHHAVRHLVDHHRVNERQQIESDEHDFIGHI